MERPLFVERLRRLQWKYEMLVRLCKQRDMAKAAGRQGFNQAETDQRSEAFKEVAAEFPGSLRELEHSSLGTLQAKYDAVREEAERAAADPKIQAPARPWVGIVLDYHHTLNDLLATKRWLAAIPRNQRVVSAELLESYKAWPGSKSVVSLPNPHVAGSSDDLPGSDISTRKPDERAFSVELGYFIDSSARPRDPARYLEEIMRPPGGRLHALVWRDLEARHGLKQSELEEAVFGLPEDLSGG